MKFAFERDHLCCNSCPIGEWDENEGFICSITEEPIMTSHYDYNDPDCREANCPLIKIED